MSRYPLFDRGRIELKRLSQRGCELRAEDVLPLAAPSPGYEHPGFGDLVESVVAARRAGRPVVAMIGGHPIKLGLSRFLIDLMERRLITHLATNGAGVIHDYELALGAGTSESVPRWIKVGQFGLWSETGGLNDLVSESARRGEGLGEGVGRAILENPARFPHADLSLVAAGYRLGIPVTSHVGIGSDIIHAHANCDGAALGATSYTDFLIFAQSILDFTHEAEPATGGSAISDRHSPIKNRNSKIKNPSGVFLNIGSAVTGPEVYLKALSMARNVARQEGREIRRFTTAVFDLAPLPAQPQDGEPAKDDPFYYFRPWKTILVRTVADGGRSFYFPGDHRQTIPALWRKTTERLSNGRRGLAA